MFKTHVIADFNTGIVVTDEIHVIHRKRNIDLGCFFFQDGINDSIDHTRGRPDYVYTSIPIANQIANKENRNDSSVT